MLQSPQDLLLELVDCDVIEVGRGRSSPARPAAVVAAAGKLQRSGRLDVAPAQAGGAAQVRGDRPVLGVPGQDCPVLVGP
jgi:hypothetical protein